VSTVQFRPLAPFFSTGYGDLKILPKTPSATFLLLLIQFGNLIWAQSMKKYVESGATRIVSALSAYKRRSNPVGDATLSQRS
jgi:hypothetical protein